MKPKFGGRFVPDTLVENLVLLEEAFRKAIRSREFNTRLKNILETYCGRPSPLTFAENLSRKLGHKIYLKREDLNHTGAHKINNCIGQALLAIQMGKTRIIAETGAGQHGVATATACALLGLKCQVFMGALDVKRQEMNVFRMKLLGAEVVPVTSGTQTLKDAINEALRYWITYPKETYYLLGSVVGPRPYPEIVRTFQSIIGREAKSQIRKAEGRLPDYIFACVGGGSNAIGIFHAFLKDKNVNLIGVEAAGHGLSTGNHSATLNRGRPGIIHGCSTYVLQDEDGQILPAHSLAPGLDYPAVGPEHSRLKDSGRVIYESVTDAEALDAFRMLSRDEGIIPALESAHAVAYAVKFLKKQKKQRLVIINISGRGDKDLYTVFGLHDKRVH